MGQYRNSIRYLSMMLWMKWYQILMCFVREWKALFLAREIADRLSPNRMVSTVKGESRLLRSM